MTTSQPPRRALVTGASSGIGAALARRLAARGIEVYLAARRRDRLEAEAAAIMAAGGRAHALVLDVARADETAAAVAQLDDACGGIDLVVANAGLGGKTGAQPLASSPWQDVRDLIQINLLGAVATLAPLVPRMLARGHGHLVGISSIAADVPTPRTAPYGASKAGLTFFLRAADLELRPRGIAVTIVHPGFVKTPMTDSMDEPLPFLVDVARAARIIDRAIARRRRLVRFPRPMAAAVGFGRALPMWLSAPLIRAAARERK
jgi:short-subunit dehydrogenase